MSPFTTLISVSRVTTSRSRSLGSAAQRQGAERASLYPSAPNMSFDSSLRLIHQWVWVDGHPLKERRVIEVGLHVETQLGAITAVFSRESED